MAKFKWKVTAVNARTHSVMVVYTALEGGAEVTVNLKLPEDGSDVSSFIEKNAPRKLEEGPVVEPAGLSDEECEVLSTLSGEAELAPVDTAQRSAQNDDLFRQRVSKVLFELGVTKLDIAAEQLKAGK